MAKDFSVVILSAGNSQRMGSHKALLEFDKERNFLQKIIQEYQDLGCKQIAVVVNRSLFTILKNDHFKLGGNVKLVQNNHPEWHRFYSLKIGVKALEKKQHTFVQNIDNPFVNKSLLQELYGEIENADYIVPSFKGKGGHPILLSKDVIIDLNETIEDKLHLKEYLGRFLNSKVSVSDDRILININTKEEYQKSLKK